jgi:hypothetical protein
VITDVACHLKAKVDGSEVDDACLTPVGHHRARTPGWRPGRGDSRARPNRRSAWPSHRRRGARCSPEGDRSGQHRRLHGAPKAVDCHSVRDRPDSGDPGQAWRVVRGQTFWDGPVIDLSLRIWAEMVATSGQSFVAACQHASRTRWPRIVLVDAKSLRILAASRPRRNSLSKPNSATVVNGAAPTRQKQSDLP